MIVNDELQMIWSEVGPPYCQSDNSCWLIRWEYSDVLIKANRLPASYWAKSRKEQAVQ